MWLPVFRQQRGDAFRAFFRTPEKILRQFLPTDSRVAGSHDGKSTSKDLAQDVYDSRLGKEELASSSGAVPFMSCARLAAGAGG